MALRLELQSLASESATCIITGRIIDMRKDGDDRFLLLKNCAVRKWEKGEVIDTHPEITTDHLWIRVPAVALEPCKPSSDVSPYLREVTTREAITMWMDVSLTGRCGFYTTQGRLGIGISETIGAIREEKLLALITDFGNCFRKHPWRVDCFNNLIEAIRLVEEHLGDDSVVLLSTPKPRLLRLLARIEQVNRRNHVAELKAARGKHSRSPANLLASNGGISLAPRSSATDATRNAEALHRHLGRDTELFPRRKRRQPAALFSF